MNKTKYNKLYGTDYNPLTSCFTDDYFKCLQGDSAIDVSLCLDIDGDKFTFKTELPRLCSKECHKYNQTIQKLCRFIKDTINRERI